MLYNGEEIYRMKKKNSKQCHLHNKAFSVKPEKWSGGFLLWVAQGLVSGYCE